MATRELTRPTAGIPSLFEDMMRPFSNFFDGGRWWGEQVSVPAVNITENKDDYRVSVAAPGLKKEDFHIDLDGNMLTISAETEEKKEDTGEHYTRKEYNYSSFTRSFNLPEEVDKEKINASYENGILQITLPKKEEVRRTAVNKRIEVR